MLKIINKGAKSDLPFSPAIQVGDLIYISGQASVEKNTGKIIPGHGGLLDRIDGMLFALPFSYLLFKII